MLDTRIELPPTSADREARLAPRQLPVRAPRVALTAAEQDVLEDAARGLTAQETAIRRIKGVETVKSQRKTVILKLGARNIAHAVAMAIRLGIVSPLSRDGSAA